MTYGSTLQRTAEQRGENTVPFLLPTETEWLKGSIALYTGAMVDVAESASLSFNPASASSVTCPEVMPAWQQPNLILLVEQWYTFRGRDEVINLLKAHPFLVPLLLEAYGKIAEYFGPSAEVVLEVVSDPEAVNDHELFALIRTSLAPQEALARLERFDQEWWLDASDRAKCLLNIDVEYI